jgi:hypothetical protein
MYKNMEIKKHDSNKSSKTKIEHNNDEPNFYGGANNGNIIGTAGQADGQAL